MQQRKDTTTTEVFFHVWVGVWLKERDWNKKAEITYDVLISDIRFVCVICEAKEIAAKSTELITTSNWLGYAWHIHFEDL